MYQSPSLIWTVIRMTEADLEEDALPTATRARRRRTREARLRTRFA